MTQIAIEHQQTICNPSIMATDSNYHEEPEFFNSDMAHLVDKHNNVYLCRGNAPLDDNAFAYDSLKQCFRIKNMLIYDICLLNEKKDAHEIAIEKDWFISNKDKGQFILHPILGTIFNPCDIPSSIRNMVYKHYDVDGMKKLMAQLNAFMNLKTKQPIMLYVHCMAGIDRTGAVCGCYLMQFKKLPFSYVVGLNEKIGDRSVDHHMMNSLRWYAYYLKEELDMTTIGKIK